ncbi:Pyrimidine-specific ribonucleoside hydrolase RihA [uncultured archaeon]|nr:Pyrimidine-specific ribonucleoside hydrolase RihA [uncultured archaeon]
MKKIIIDTDPGVDDALAIMLAVKSSLLDVKAITTVMGNSTIENTTRNAGWILDILDEKNIPIYSGSEKPLSGELKTAFVMGDYGLGGLKLENNFSLSNNAVEKILEIVSNNPGEISIVAIGPLTNIAKAIQENFEVMKKVKEIIIMGGAIKVPGNMNKVAEFNIYNDPLAAEIVFNFPVSKTLIPLDLCNQVELSEEDFNKIDSKLKKPILEMVGEFMSRLEINETGKRVALVYDALAVYYLLNPEIYLTENLDVRVETNGKLTRGMTVADLRKVREKEVNFKVAFRIDPQKFVVDFIITLSEETYLNKQNISNSRK